VGLTCAGVVWYDKKEGLRQVYTIDISDLQSLISAGKTLWSEHVALRLRERNIKRADVIACIKNGQIIEQYPNDMPFPSCLIFGISETGKHLHVVCGLNPGVCCCVVTAYYPNPDKWESDYRTRKAGE